MVKRYSIDFHTCQLGAGDENNRGNMARLLARLVDEGAPTLVSGSVEHEVRALHSFQGGAVVQGVLAKLRHDGIPHAGTRGGGERELPLEDDEGLIDKNHFMYFREHDLLVYQANRDGSSIQRLGVYLASAAGEAVAFHPVLQLEPMLRLMRGEAEVRSLDVSFARPTNPQLFPANQWDRMALSLLAGAGGSRISLQISGDGRSDQPEARYLVRDVKDAIVELVRSGAARKARLEVEEDGVRHPIDLIADRLASKQDVEMAGRYPIPASMFAALRRAYDEHRDTLEQIFGAPGRAIA